MKKLNKIISFIMTCIVFLAVSTCVFAGSLLPELDPGLPDSGGNEIETMINDLLGIGVAAGYGVAIGMLIYVGIKYTMSAANEKADLKTSSIKYLIGAIILFSVTAVFDIVQELVEQITASA